MNDYDGDVKIYVGKAESEASDFDGIAKDIGFHKENGNLLKAQRLGAAMADLKPDDESLGILRPDDDLTSPILYQARVLITFLCGRCARENIKAPILTDTARGAMYDRLKENEHGYYTNIADGAAFSFYRLALKKPGDKAQLVGDEFAKLCGSANDVSLKELGVRIYSNTVDYLIKLIDECDFKY